MGDAGYGLRGELQSPWAIPWALPSAWEGVGVVATPYLFGAYGEVLLYQPTALEAGSVRASSFGGTAARIYRPDII